MRVLAIVLYFGFASGAYAGCANYEDGSMVGPAPVYEICYKSQCDVTTMLYECANVTNYSAAYAIGWATQCSVDKDCEITWQGRLIDPSKHKYITFKEISE